MAKRPDHIEDYLVRLHTGQWVGGSDASNKIYDNLIIHDNAKSKPSEADCISGLATIQADFDDKITKKDSGKQKLKDVAGLTDDEIKALTGK